MGSRDLGPAQPKVFCMYFTQVDSRRPLSMFDVAFPLVLVLIHERRPSYIQLDDGLDNCRHIGAEYHASAISRDRGPFLRIVFSLLSRRWPGEVPRCYTCVMKSAICTLQTLGNDVMQG